MLNLKIFVFYLLLLSSSNTGTFCCASVHQMRRHRSYRQEQVQIPEEEQPEENRRLQCVLQAELWLHHPTGPWQVFQENGTQDSSHMHKAQVRTSGSLENQLSAIGAHAPLSLRC